jgi:hypothetical protein
MIPRPAYSGHYWYGVDYTSSNSTATSVSVPMTIPDDYPQNNFYYVLLSVWDSNASYDQIGFMNDNGVWTVAYTTTPYCAGPNNNIWNTVYNYTYNPSIDTTYNFSMSIHNGNVTFSVGNVWNVIVYTGGSTFQIGYTYTCDSLSWYDFTEYEEIYNVNNYAPPYPIILGNTLVDNTSDMNWAVFNKNAPSVITSSISMNSVVIYNEPFVINVYPGYALPEALSSQSSLTYDINVSEISYDSKVCVSYYSSTFSTVSFPKSCVTPSSSIDMIYSVSYHKDIKYYTIGIDVSDSSGNYTRAIIVINVVQNDASGCVFSTMLKQPTGCEL